MFAIQSVSIPASTMRELLNFAADCGSLDAVADIADQAIRDWLARAKEAHGPATPASAPAHIPAPGYQWKTLFLPEGTQLRAWSRESGARYTEVIGSQILHAGLPVTPNQFVRQLKGIPRNAWTEISLLMPGESAWKPAHVRRSEQRRAERALRTPQPPQGAPAPAVPTSPPATSPTPTSPPPNPPSAASPPHTSPPHTSPPPTSPPPDRQQATSPHHPSPSPAAPTPAMPAARAPANAAPTLSASHPAPAQPQRLPRVPPSASQAKIHAARTAITGHGHWWPGAPERRTFARRAEDAFLD